MNESNNISSGRRIAAVFLSIVTVLMLLANLLHQFIGSAGWKQGFPFAFRATAMSIDGGWFWHWEPLGTIGDMVVWGLVVAGWFFCLRRRSDDEDAQQTSPGDVATRAAPEK